MKTKGFNVVDVSEKNHRLVEAMGQEVFDDLLIETADKIIGEQPEIADDTLRVASKAILWMHEVYIEKQLN